MQDSERERLRRAHTTLLEVRPRDILPHLRQHNVFDEDDEERILAATTTKDKMRVLLGLLPLRGPQAYPIFRQALMTDYDWIVTEMESPVTKSDGSRPRTEPGTKCCALKEINNKVLRKVAHHPEVLRDWKSLARCLGVEDHDIVDIEFANQLSVKEASYQALVRWQARRGRAAAPSALVAGLRDGGFTHLADELEDVGV